MKRDEKGNFLCDCGRAFATSAGLGGHRRNCKLQAANRCPVVGASPVGFDRATGNSPTLLGTSVDGQAPYNAVSPSPSPIFTERNETLPAAVRMPDPE